jgi:hypothetical protein
MEINFKVLIIGRKKEKIIIPNSVNFKKNGDQLTPICKECIRLCPATSHFHHCSFDAWAVPCSAPDIHLTKIEKLDLVVSIFST